MDKTIHTSDELRYAMASFCGNKKRELAAISLKWPRNRPLLRHDKNLPEICRRKLETFRFAPLTRTWGKRRRAGVLALLHVASRGIRVKLNAISLRLVPVGKPAHDNLKLVNTLLLKMGTNMYKFHQVISETGRLLWLGSSKPNRCARNADVTRSSSSLSWKG